MLDREKCRLLVIDLQERLLPVIPDNDSILANAKFLMDVCGIMQIPVVVSEQYPKGLGNTVAPVANHPAITHRFEKLTFSATDGYCEVTQSSGLGLQDGAWTGTEADQVLLCGIESHVCVQQTALRLLERGFRVYLAADAVGSRNEIDHVVALQRMRDSGVTITTVETAAFELCRVAGTDEFRQISNLVKRRANA